MVTPDDVKKLAALARIRVDDADLEKFTSEFDAVLAYVGQLETVNVAAAADGKPPVRTVMRADGEPHASGAYTEKLAAQFPSREGDALSVKQIIQHD